MIFEKKIKCIIMLCKLNEEMPEKVFFKGYADYKFNSLFMYFFQKWSCFAFWNDLDDTKIGNYTIKSKIVDNKCTYSKRTLTITNPVIFSKIFYLMNYIYHRFLLLLFPKIFTDFRRDNICESLPIYRMVNLIYRIKRKRLIKSRFLFKYKGLIRVYQTKLRRCAPLLNASMKMKRKCQY
jgi:hypothetical protein